jgi:heme-degrading monooxygenase HmoA
MIARIWHGRTQASRAAEYLDFLNRTGVPDYKATPGNRAVFVLHRIEGEEAHFLTLTLWDSLESIAGFAGPDIDKAKYYPKDEDFLLEFEPTVTHYTVAESPE